MFAEKLKALRGIKGLTQKGLAETLNVAQGAVAMWETGKRTPDVEMIKKIASYFNVSTDYLMGESKYKNNQEVKDYNWGFGDPYFEAAFDFAGLLKERREFMDISLSALGQTIGANAEQMEAIEDGLLPITFEQAEKLSNYLGTNVSQVMFDNELYGEEVPEKYHKNVREWERKKKEIDEEAMRESGETLNPDIRMIARAGKKMTPEQAENLRKYAQFMFPEAFKDD